MDVVDGSYATVAPVEEWLGLLARWVGNLRDPLLFAMLAETGAFSED